MNLKSLILLSLVLASCTRQPLSNKQAEDLRAKNPGATVGQLIDNNSGPTAVVRMADGSVRLFVFAGEFTKEPLYEEELIPATQPP